MKYLLLVIFSLLISGMANSQTWQTNKAKLQPDGSLSYEEDTDKNRMPDFSYAGYKGGGVAIPEVPVKITIFPVFGDNTANIQNAIDAVSAMAPDENGFRGVVLLSAGRYPVSGQIFVHTSGVVLRGIGDGRDSRDITIIYGTGNSPAQRDLIVIGGGTNTKWQGEVSKTRQNIITDFVQVGSHTFEITDASNYSVGDNIIINHPCSTAWLNAIEFGGTESDPAWSENQYPIIYNRYITAISGNEITIDAPVYNHLDKSLSQSYIYKYDREGLVTNVGVENLRVEIESLGGEDENHVWNAIQFTQVEDAWARNTTVTGFGLSGIRTATASRISIVNVHSLDPVAIMTGARMYNFNSYVCSNNILFDNCYARNGRHHYVSNGKGSVSGFVVLRSISENPNAASEGHRHWTTGMLFDNLIDIGTFPTSTYTLAFYNRGDYGSGHGWSAAHSVFWNCDVSRPGKDAAIIVEKPPTAQNYAIGCKGLLDRNGPFNQTKGYVEGTNKDDQLIPVSLYEAQLLDRTGTVISDFSASETKAAINESITFSAKAQGDIASYNWDFGEGATPSKLTGIGPHVVKYSIEGDKTVTLSVSNGTDTHSETKTAYININDKYLNAVKDVETFLQNESVSTFILDNDSYPDELSNYAYSFDGIDDNITYESTTLIDQYPFTMMCWLKTASSSGQTIIYIGNPNSGILGNSLSIRSGKARLEAWDYKGTPLKEDIADNNTINDNEWHHVAGVFSSPTERYLYVDGTLVGSDYDYLDNLTNQNLSRLSVANRADASPDDWFQGELDEVRIYSSALSVSDINSIMQGRDCSDNEKLLYWNFDKQPSAFVRDQFNYFDGIISGGSSSLSQVVLESLSAEIVKEPQNGTAYFSNDFEITYVPKPNYYGLDELQYELLAGECDRSAASILYHIDEVTGVNEVSSNSIVVYPNPTKGIIYFNTNDIKSVKLYSSSGAFLQNLRVSNECNLSHLNSGVYILVFESFSGEFSSCKIVRI